MAMADQHIYTIPLLNDIHNHFPDILYNPRRFRNIHDLLDYIRQVAQISPYERGRYRYRTRLEQPEPVYIPLNNSIFGRIITELVGDMDDLESVIVRPTEQEISTATTVYRVNSLQDDICTICQDTVESGEVRRVTQCGHYFHRVCIDTWFQGNVLCPTCRHDIRT